MCPAALKLQSVGCGRCPQADITRRRRGRCRGCTAGIVECEKRAGKSRRDCATWIHISAAEIGRSGGGAGQTGERERYHCFGGTAGARVHSAGNQAFIAVVVEEVEQRSILRVDVRNEGADVAGQLEPEDVCEAHIVPNADEACEHSGRLGRRGERDVGEIRCEFLQISRRLDLLLKPREGIGLRDVRHTPGAREPPVCVDLNEATVIEDEREHCITCVAGLLSRVDKGQFVRAIFVE